MGRISKGTYEKNFVTFNAALLAEKASAEPEQPPEVIAPERTTISQAEEDKTMLQLDSLLDEIEQGNDTPEMREKLKLGMSKQQVRFVLGTPMVNDVFHENRWDYAYRLEQGGKLVETQHLTTFFEGENLVRVEDNGPGIPEKNLDRVFESFFTTKPVGHGTGLGLSISQDIIHAHGGEIRAENIAEGGCAFVISLPGQAG